MLDRFLNSSALQISRCPCGGTNGIFTSIRCPALIAAILSTLTLKMLAVFQTEGEESDSLGLRFDCCFFVLCADLSKPFLNAEDNFLFFTAKPVGFSRLSSSSAVRLYPSPFLLKAVRRAQCSDFLSSVCCDGDNVRNAMAALDFFPCNIGKFGKLSEFSKLLTVPLLRGYVNLKALRASIEYDLSLRNDLCSAFDGFYPETQKMLGNSVSGKIPNTRREEHLK